MLNKINEIDVKIVALCRTKKQTEELFPNESNIEYLIQTVEEPINLKQKVDYVIHAASPASPELFRKNPTGTIIANTLGTYNTLEVAKVNNAKYVFISTMEIYGVLLNDNEDVYEEEYGAIDSLNIRSCYHLSKKTAENMCIAYKEQYGIEVCIVRPAHTYGPGMDINSERVQCEFIKKALNNENIILKSDGTMKRTYTYISDLVSGIFKAMLDGKDIVYNIVNQKEVISIRELAEVIIESTVDCKSKIIIKVQELKGCAVEKSKILNSSKLLHLGWSPKIDIKEGFKRTIEFYRLIEEK